MKITCKYCNKEYSRPCGLAIHERICSLNPNRKPFENHVCNWPGAKRKPEGWICKDCGTHFETKHALYDHRHTEHNLVKRLVGICPYCGEYYEGTRRAHCLICTKKQQGPKLWTSEEKKHLSDKRKEYLKNHPNEHPWKRNNKFKSKPCEHLKEILRKDFDFVEEYTDKRWQHNFSLDIAFLDKKLAIEVNGNQHYNNDGTLTEYYQKRHDYIESEGWLILEVHYAACYKDDKISEIKDAIVNCKNINLEEHKLLFENRQKTKKEKELEKEQKYKYAKENGLIDASGHINKKLYKTSDLEKYKKLILSSGVDLMKYGFRSKLIKTTNLSAKKINYTLNYFNIDHYLLKNRLIKEHKKYDWNAINQERYLKIINCGVDLTKYGWIKKVSIVTGLSKKQIHRLINLTDLKEIVYIRKA